MEAPLRGRPSPPARDQALPGAPCPAPRPAPALPPRSWACLPGRVAAAGGPGRCGQGACAQGRGISRPPLCHFPLPTRVPTRGHLSTRFFSFLPPQEVRSTTVAFLLLRIPTLKIKTVSKKEVFEANLKTECDLWHLMVKEMWAGKKLADDHKVWGRARLLIPTPDSSQGLGRGPTSARRVR